MNLEFDTDSEDLIERAASVFRRAAPVDRLRTAAHRQLSWQTLHEAGWASLGTGLAGGDLDPGTAAGVYREAGRQLLIEEMVTAGYLLPALIAHVDGPSDGLKMPLRHAPGVLLGDGRAESYSIGPLDHGLCFGASDPLPAVYRLNRAAGGRIILELHTGGTATCTPVAGLSPSVATVRITDGAWTATPLQLGDSELVEVRRLEMLLHSAAMVGCAEAALEATRDYTLHRVQFGVPIGRFQAIQHALADVLAANEVAWAALLCACAATDDVAFRTDVARLLSVEAALAAARAAAQFHGGIGFTTEAGVHHYLKAALDGSCRFGSTDRIAVRIGRSLVGSSC